MKKKSIITVAAVAVAGIAAYFVRRKIAGRNRADSEPAGGHTHRHATNAFSKAKSVASGEWGKAAGEHDHTESPRHSKGKHNGGKHPGGNH